MASRWLFRKAFHCFPGSRFLGAFPIHLNSPCIRGTPHLGFSPTMRKINSRNSLLALPTRSSSCREHHVQYNLKPVRCQPTTVSGETMTSVRFHPNQHCRSITPKTLSEVVGLGLQRRLFKTVSCCHKAKTSSKSRREHKLQAIRPRNNLNVPSIHRFVSEHLPPNFSPDSILATHRYL